MKGWDGFYYRLIKTTDSTFFITQTLFIYCCMVHYDIIYKYNNKNAPLNDIPTLALRNKDRMSVVSGMCARYV